jgi:hypothetical protein
MSEKITRSGVWVFTVLSSTTLLLLLIVAVGHFAFGSTSNAVAYLAGDRIFADATSKEFGQLKPGQVKRVEFKLHNYSKSSITIYGSSSSCTCTVAENLPLTIPAGETRSLPIQVETTEKALGRFEQTVKLYTNGNAKREFDLKLLGQITY